jgi:hypothetical protein
MIIRRKNNMSYIINETLDEKVTANETVVKSNMQYRLNETCKSQHELIVTIGGITKMKLTPVVGKKMRIRLVIDLEDI